MKQECSFPRKLLLFMNVMSRCNVEVFPVQATLLKPMHIVLRLITLVVTGRAAGNRLRWQV